MIYPNAVEEPGNQDHPLLLRVFPNPASQKVCFPFVLPEKNQSVTLMIYDNSGNLKDTLVNQVMNEGDHRINWDVKGLAPGIYYCKLQAGNLSATQRFVVIP
jgi:hypothetical protein